MRLFNGFLVTTLALLIPGQLASASFHLMQIEQVIGGVNGDTTAQAVQLRIRSNGQNLVSQASLRAVDATGANSIFLENIAANVPNGQAGRRILLATPNFANYTNVPLVPDFVMDPIPASYLAAGQLRFMDDFSTIWWSLSWGGAGFTGSTTGIGGTGTNDGDGNFGPPVNVALPSTTLQALQFTGAASAFSTNNLAQYVVTAGAATFINNAGTSFTVTLPPPPVTPGDFNDDGVVDTADYVIWRKTEGTNFDLGGNGDETGGSANTVDMADYSLWVTNFGEVSAGSGASAPIPEPVNLAIVLVLALTASGLRARRPLLRRRGAA